MALQLIKINEFPDSGALADTDFLAIGLPDGTAAKIDIASARAFLGVSVIKGIAEPSTDPEPATTGDTWLAGVGTFTNFLDSGGVAITTTENLNAFTYNGTFWDVLPIPISVDLSGYATQAEFEEVNDITNAIQADLNRVSHPSKNLINRMLIEAGNYNVNGNKQDSDNWIRTPHFSVLPSTDYTLSGYGSAASNARICYYDENHDFISFVAPEPGTAAITFTTPAGTSFVGITVANDVGAGLDPTNSTYALTVQFEIGTTATDYEAYGLVLESASLDNIEYINSLGESIDEITIESKNLIDKSQIAAGAYSSTTGSTSTSINWIHTPHIPVLESTEYTLSGYDPFGSTVARFCFFDVGGGFLSSVLSEGPDVSTPITFITPANTAFVGINVANELDIGLTPTDNPFSNGVQLEEGASATSYQPYGTLLDASKLSGDESGTLSGGYYTFEATGGGGDGQFTVYSRVGQSNSYIGFALRHEVDAAEDVYADLWRLYDAHLFNFVNSSMVPTGIEALASGENECVYKFPGTDDFTGGFHGDEKIISGNIWFYANGVKIDTASDIGMTSCESFQYRQQSNMYQAPMGGVINHTIQAIHDKITTIEGGGYKTFNRLTWQADLTIQLWYHGISCIGKSFSSEVMNEHLSVATMVGGDARFLEVVGARRYFGNNEANSLSAEASSVLLSPVDMDPLCNMFVWDRSADSKYYRQTPDDEPVLTGDVWESEMTVKFDRS